LARTKELTKSPAQNASIDPMTRRHVLPNTVSIAGWTIALYGTLGAAGMRITTKLMNVANTIAPKPAHTTLRARA
jgi:hypothetical protein